MPRSRLAALISSTSLLALLPACIDREVTQVTTEQDSVEKKLVPASVNRELDILFVIDNSQSMTEENRSLVNNFSRLLSRLYELDGGLPDLHLAVVTPDLGIAGAPYGTCNTSGGDRARMRTCPALGGATYLSDVRGPDGNRIKNYAGTLDDAFSCLANVGAAGCGFEQHLGAMALALSPGVNDPGFLRPEAALAVVIIADEDDCSAADRADPRMFASPSTLGDFACHREGVVCDDDPDPAAPGIKRDCRPRDGSAAASIQGLANSLKALKADPDQIVVVGIIGDPGTVEVGRDTSNRPEVVAKCPDGGLGASEPGIRLTGFFDQFKQTRRSVSSLCTSDLARALEDASEVISNNTGSTCLTGTLADRNPTRDGLQAECSVVQLNGDVKRPIPTCELAGDARPCWRLEPHADCRASDHHLRVLVERTEAAPLGTYLSIECVVE